MTEELKKDFSKLRFVNENGDLYPEWEEVKFDELLKAAPNRNYQIESSQVLDEGNIPVIDQGKSFIAGFSNESSKIFPRNNKNYIVYGDHTTVVKYIDFDFMLGGDGTKVLDLKKPENSIKFAYHSLCFNNAEPEGYKRHFSILRKKSFPIPSLPEQEKIANFLSKFDEKIEAQAKLVELRKTEKQAYMQRIFGSDNNHRSLRFKNDDGTDYPDWEIKKLGEVSECLDNKRKPLNGIERRSISGNIPYYGSTSIQGYVNDYIFDEELVLLGEDAAPFYEFREKAIAQYVNEKCWVNNHVHVLRAKENTRFLFYSLVHKDVRKFVSSKTRGKLNQSDMVKILVPIPSLPEQEKIAAFLTNLDNRIEKETNKLEKLKLAKQGYMQKVLG